MACQEGRSRHWRRMFIGSQDETHRCHTKETMEFSFQLQTSCALLLSPPQPPALVSPHGSGVTRSRSNFSEIWLQSLAERASPQAAIGPLASRD